MPAPQLIPLGKLRPAADDVRDERDEGHIARLTAAMRQFDFVGALGVFPTGDGYYEVVGGSTRLEAARRAGLESIPCVILAARPEAAKLRLMRLQENLFRSDMTILEEARNYQQLMKDNGWSAKQLAAQMGDKKYEVRISKSLTVGTKLHPALHPEVLTGAMRTTSAYAIARFVPLDAQPPFWDRVKAETVERIEALAEEAHAKQAGSAPRAKPTTVEVDGTKVTVSSLDAALTAFAKLTAVIRTMIARKAQPSDLPVFLRLQG